MEREMDATSNAPAQAGPQLCRGNCGFYGSPALDNYCSKCAKEQIKRTQDTLAGQSTSISPPTEPNSVSINEEEEVTLSQVATTAIPVATASVSPPAEVVPAPQAESSGGTSTATPNLDDTASPKPKLKANRCHTCKRKVGLLGFDCRCGGKFCSDHRYSDAHDCAFDYKQLGQAEVRKNNPAVVCAKIEKI